MRPSRKGATFWKDYFSDHGYFGPPRFTHPFTPSSLWWDLNGDDCGIFVMPDTSDGVPSPSLWIHRSNRKALDGWCVARHANQPCGAGALKGHHRTSLEMPPRCSIQFESRPSFRSQILIKFPRGVCAVCVQGSSLSRGSPGFKCEEASFRSGYHLTYPGLSQGRRFLGVGVYCCNFVSCNQSRLNCVVWLFGVEELAGSV